jgi:hypothetical protein
MTCLTAIVNDRFLPYIIIFKMTSQRVILKKSLLTHCRKWRTNSCWYTTKSVRAPHEGFCSWSFTSGLILRLRLAPLSFVLLRRTVQYDTVPGSFLFLIDLANAIAVTFTVTVVVDQCTVGGSPIFCETHFTTVHNCDVYRTGTSEQEQEQE